MSTSPKTIKPSISGVWILDDGHDPRIYYTTETLALALSRGYGNTVQEPERTPSLQWFGDDGYSDLTKELLNKPYPNHQPKPESDPVANIAQKDLMNGDPTDWLALRKAGDKLDAKARRELTHRISSLKAQNLKPVS